MTKRLYILIIATMLLPTSMVWSQSNNEMRQVYTEAESAYQLGQLDQAIDLLEDHLNDFSGNLRQSALRLVSICYLAQDDEVCPFAAKYQSLLYICTGSYPL